MSTNPIISVIMPVYNAERYIAEAVESILAQTFTDFEFLIIDDGSTDGSLEILERYAAQDARIRLRSRPNTGYVVALNEMLADARGEFIARMDADDISKPERFAIQLRLFEEFPEAVCVGCRTMLIDPDGDALRPFGSYVTHEDIDQAHMQGRGGAISHPSMMARADAIQQVAGYRPELCPAEDIDLCLRLAELGTLRNCEDILLAYRLHPESVGHQRRVLQRERCFEAVRQAHERRNLPFTMTEHDKTLSDIDHLRGIYCRWGWWALRAGNVRVARKHAFRAVCHTPLSLNAWNLAACSLRGY